MSVESDIFGYEEVLSAAIQTVLDALDVRNLTINDDPEFQSDRPRCDVAIMVGPSEKNLYAEAGIPTVPGYSREMTFTGVCQIEVITDASPEIHKTYRARVRNACSTICREVNTGEAPGLVRHKLQSFKAGQCSYEQNASDGYYKTTMNYDLKFSIQMNAFADLS